MRISDWSSDVCSSDLFGGGLLSSYAETLSSLTSPEPRRIWLDIERGMRTKYHFDEFQRVYFVVAGFDELLHATEEADFASLYARIADQPDLETGDACPGDSLYAGRLPPLHPGPALIQGWRPDSTQA